MRNLTTLSLLLFLSLVSYSQNNFYFDIVFSGVNLTNTEIISQDPKLGASGGAAFRYQLPYERLSIGPVIQIDGFSEYPIDNISFNNVYLYKAGAQAHFSLLKSSNDKYEVSLLGEIGFTYAKKDSSYIIPDGSYTLYRTNSSWSYSSEDLEEFNLYKGSGLSFSSGVRIRYSIFFIEGAYEVFSPTMASDDETVNNPAKTVQLDRFKFSFGVSYKMEL